ncbi:Ras-related protein Rap-1 [Grifola frondosa]|uniref:Ras-related protein Rap-1 n=1 Tax=Grifola frondosa TaxID=5627 RepID=A0A1C7M6R6_GRIFR|nr:Ras-related protein Rap-1 [Grifola frondosa]
MYFSLIYFAAFSPLSNSVHERPSVSISNQLQSRVPVPTAQQLQTGTNRGLFLKNVNSLWPLPPTGAEGLQVVLTMRKYSAVVLGAGGVGKSALTIRYGRNVFVEHYNPTIEEEYHCQLIVDGERCSLDILDTAGAEQFTGFNEGYLKNGHGFILVFSLTQDASLREIDNVRQQILHLRGGDMNIPVVVVGTKLDLASEREVPRATIQELATRWGIPFYETSAKRNWHVTDVFEDLVRQMRRCYPNGQPKMKKWRKDPCVVM